MNRPGWYPDPGNPAASRYWNGQAWTQHVRTPEDEARRTRNRGLLLGIGSVVFIALVMASGVGLGRSGDGGKPAFLVHEDDGARFGWAKRAGSAWSCITEGETILCGGTTSSSDRIDISPGSTSQSSLLAAFEPRVGMVTRYDPAVWSCDETIVGYICSADR